MEKYNKVLLWGGLALILVGCSTNQTTKLSSQTVTDELSDSETVVQEYNSIATARNDAIAETDELVMLEESLASLDENGELLGEPPGDELLAEDDNSNAPLEPGEATPPLSADAASIWPRIRDGFSLGDKDHPRVQADKNWYAEHQSYLDRTFGRAEPYLYYIVEQVAERGMPMEIALLPVVESAFQPFAYSHGRASGIWQFIPSTARLYGLKIDWWYDGRRDIYAATNAALNYLESLATRFDGDWMLALAAYNSGEGTVRRAIRKNQKSGKGTSYWDLNLPKETRGYVPKLLAISSIVESPDSFGVTLKEIKNKQMLAKVDIGSQLDLAIAADMAGMSLEDLYIYNPAFNRWATSPNGPHRLLLPTEKAESFKEQIAQLPSENRVKWARHRINDGETLSHIAMKYKTTVKIIKNLNNIRNNMIRAGNYLIIPVSSLSANSYALSADQRLHDNQNTPRKGTKVFHIVQRGDTLWNIAQSYKVPVNKLAKWNGMAPNDTLHQGQKLVIWSTKAFPLASVHDTSAADTMRKINYRVRNGDSLARISQKFNVSIQKLKNWNPSARGKYLQPGQRLVLYVDVTQVAENI